MVNRDPSSLNANFQPDEAFALWADLGVDARFEGKTAWYSNHDVFRESAARLVGARPGELIESMDDLSIDTKAQLLWKTAAEFLGLSEEALLGG